MPRPGRYRKSLKNSDGIENDSNTTLNRSHTINENDFEEEFHQDEGTYIIDDIYMPPPPIQPTNFEDQTGKRLIIETIEIINFKSYGGRSVLGPFNKSFNSIVGPNGSGKSNVIDSMLFVFGYRAQKLRSNKISSIIHHSEQLPNCDFARVNVNFAMIDDKGDDKLDIIPDSNFTISRVVHKDNSSYYLIDDRKVLFKDVSKRLQDFGIDLRYNRFLILQGEVEQISLMKPKADEKTNIGMLEYLEDIIGTSRYREPIKLLGRKVNECTEKKSQCHRRVNLSKIELDRVCEAKNEAVRALELENEKKIQKSYLIQHNLHVLKKKMSKQEAEYKEYEDQMNLMNQEEENIQNEKIKLVEEEKIICTEYSRIKKELDDLKEKVQELEKNDFYLISKNKTAKSKLKNLKLQMAKDEERFNDLKDTPSQNDEKIELLQKSVLEIEEQLKQVNESIKSEAENVQIECNDLVQKREELNNKIMKFKDEQTDKLNRKNEAYNQFIILKQKTDGTRDKYEQLKSKLKQIQDETGEKVKLIERYEQEIPVEKSKLRDFHKQYEKLEQRRAHLTQIINQKNTELHSLKESVNQTQSRDTLRNALMEEKRKGNLPGIFGRLGDLGAIDKKYDIAITTACGQLNNFVVDTIENAERCVRFLKRNNLPSATFISLDKIRVHWSDNVTYPENIPRLFDLVQINDERIRPAFYFALGETLVANDIDQANRITKNARYRIVTLKGDMIQRDGAMTGGGRPRSGGMGQSIVVDNSEISEEEILNLQQRLNELIEEQRKIDYEIDNVRENITKLEKDIKFIEDKLNSLPLEVKDSDGRMQQIQKNIEQQKFEWEKLKDNQELKNAEQKYEKAKEIYEKEMSKLDSIEDEMRKIDEEMREKLDQKLKPLKKKAKSLEKTLKETQNELTELLTEKQTIELNLKNLEESLINNKKSIEELENEIEENKKKIQELEINAKEINEKFAKTQEEASLKEEQLNKIRKKISSLDQRLKEIKNKCLDFKLEAEKRFQGLKERREKVLRLKDELESIKLDPIDDFDDDDDNGNKEEEKTEKNQDSIKKEVDDDDDTEEDDKDNDENDDTILMDVDEITLTSENDQIGDVPRKTCINKEDKTKIPILNERQLEELDLEMIERKIKSIEQELHKLNPNFASLDEYRQKYREHRKKESELEDADQKRELYQTHLDKTLEKRRKEFKLGFVMISRKLKELYRTITLGGDADLEYVDSMDPFNEGINFAVRPNKKSWKNNINLSGGEKTLASLALIFALHYYKPSPLYIMDEIDAALDFKNVSIIASYIKTRTKNTQFLIISLRNNMYELADRLIGIYKTFNITKSIPFDPNAFDSKLKMIQQISIPITTKTARY